MTGSAQDFTFIEGINEDSHWLTAKFDHRIVWDLGKPFAMLKLDLTPPSGEGTILNRARHKNLVWVGRHCHLGEKLHQPGFQLGHQGTSGVWLLLGNTMYIVQILHCKNANIIDYVVSARDSRRMEHMYIYSKKHKVDSTITSRRLCFFSLTTTTTTTRNVQL